MYNASEISGLAAGYSSVIYKGNPRVARKTLPRGLVLSWPQRISLGRGNEAIYILNPLFVHLVLAAQYESFIPPLR
jgi:hypothetical protein